MICNVPNEVVKNVKMGTWCGSSVAEKMIANGIPLDKLRAEIEFEVDHRTNMLCAEDVFAIFDKYKTESEGKE